MSPFSSKRGMTVPHVLHGFFTWFFLERLFLGMKSPLIAKKRTVCAPFGRLKSNDAREDEFSMCMSSQDDIHMENGLYTAFTICGDKRYSCKLKKNTRIRTMMVIVSKDPCQLLNEYYWRAIGATFISLGH